MATPNWPSEDSTRAWCGHILRMDASPSNFYEFNPQAPAPHEIDHFIEVQHVVDLLFTEKGTLKISNFHEVRLGYWIDLSTFVNQRENMYQISRAENQRKKDIKWANYAPARRDPLIRIYMARITGGYHHDPNKIGRTVEAQVHELAVAMAWRRGPWAFLTRQVGQQICEHMNWREGILTHQQHLEIGDFDRQEWMGADNRPLGPRR